MTTSAHQQLFQRYIHAGAISRDRDAVAALFTEDGVFETPLSAVRLVGHEAIASYLAPEPPAGTLNQDLSRFVLHETTDPDVFIAEIDSVFDTADGPLTVPLVQIFRCRGDRIALLRDYF
jgi:limonene-1,2-epoxide hydrolase